MTGLSFFFLLHLHKLAFLSLNNILLGPQLPFLPPPLPPPPQAIIMDWSQEVKKAKIG